MTRLVTSLSALIALSGLAAPAQTVNCGGVADWGGTTTYPAGIQVVHKGGLYRSLVSTTNVQPDYCLPCGWWEFLGTCGTAPTCSVAPAVPTGLTSSAVTTSGLSLSWAASTAPSGCTVSYKVFQNGVQVATPGTNGVTLTGLTANTSYAFTVAAVDQAGTSAPSAAITVKTAAAAACTAKPSVPAALASSNITTSAVTLSWAAVTPPANCAVTYRVYSKGIQIKTGLTSPTATITGLTAGTSYSFTVAAVDAAGLSAQSAALAVKTLASGTCAAAPSVPSGLSSSGITSSAVTLNWAAVTPPANCAVTYRVYSRGIQIKTGLTSPTATITGLAAGTGYSFTVAAVDAAGISAKSSALAVTTLPVSTCATAPAVPTGLASSAITTSGATLTWNAVAAPANCSVTYKVYRDGTLVTTVPTTSAVIGGLSAGTSYAFTVASSDAAGTSAKSAALTVQTLPDNPSVTSTGTVNFHLLLGVSSTMDRMSLDGDRYTDLIMSNFVAGAMQGRLIDEYYPGLQYDKDYMYGSIMAQLLQENLATYLYTPDQDLIAPAPEQQQVMGQGQGGPYQINNYAVDMVNGTFTPAGYAMINFVALQKNIGYTMATAPLQYTQNTPASFNNKYFSPILTAYFHYIDFVAMYETGKGPGGWNTPWQPAFDTSLVTFKSLPNNFLDVLLNVGYNQGFYGGILARYCSQGATATAATVSQVRSYSSVWGKTSTYEQYPYQVMYYLDQMYGNPIPTTSATTMITPGNHIAFRMGTLGGVFSKVFQTLAYVNASGQYVSITDAQASAAYTAALGSVGVASTATLDLAKAGDRARIFSVLEKAILNLETSLGIQFNARTNVQL